MAMLEFPRDTKDSTEREYWPSLEQFYPAYKTFWEKFVGVRVIGHLKPYGLKKGKEVLNDSKQEYKTYMKMCVCHYSIFCDIVIAQLELNDITELAQTQQSLEHWRHFEHFYIRLRSIQDRFERMWDFAGDFCAPGSSILPPFDQYKKDNDDDKIIQQYNDWSNEVRAIANNIIHFGRLGSKIFDNQFLLPKNLASLKDADKDIPWYSYAAVHPNDFVPTVTKMEEHFNATFSWLDPLERRLEGLLKQAMAKSAIKINYDDVIPAAPPSDGIILCRGSSATSGASAYEDPLDQSCQSQCETGSESGTEELEQDGQ